ncbi:MAG: hypothetical protein OXI73_01645 [Rhodospirillales bacterium]|nr:hypothetical protein [Rhodospirillales bacterium]
MESGRWFAPDDAFREITRVLAVMPGTLTQRLPHTHIQVVDHLGRRAGGLASFEIERPTPLHHRILDDGSIWWWRTEPLGVFFQVRLLARLGLIEPGSIFDSGGGIWPHLAGC